MECSIHAPSPFIAMQIDKLLPAWSYPVASLLIVLQRASCDLEGRSRTTEAQKNQLRQQFLEFGSRIVRQLQPLGHRAELFDPKTGYPVFSQPGQLWLDDVAVIQTCLGYPTSDVQGCRIILHPVWGSAIYPSVVLSSAEPPLLERVTKRCSTQVPRD